MKNRDAGKYIKEKRSFKGNNMFGLFKGENYVVYSYGQHFPILAWIAKENKWYRNTDKYSVSTSHHQTYVNVIKDCIIVDLKGMEDVLNEI